VWPRRSPGTASPLRRRKPPPAGGLTDAVALATLGQLSADSVEHKATKALRSIFDDLWSLGDTPAPSAGLDAAAGRREIRRSSSSAERVDNDRAALGIAGSR
jgi:hypothetical protein